MLIVVEGSDGVGKSTLIKKVMQHLSLNGVSAVDYPQPGGTPVGMDLRGIAKKHYDEDTSNETLYLIMLAARIELMKRHVIPALAGGKVVILDRGEWATLAYQCPDGKPLFPDVHKAAHPIVPDLIVYVRADPEAVIKRLEDRGESLDALEDVDYTTLTKRFVIMEELSSNNNVFIVDAENLDTLNDDTTALLEYIEEITWASEFMGL